MAILYCLRNEKLFIQTNHFQNSPLSQFHQNFLSPPTHHQLLLSQIVAPKRKKEKKLNSEQTAKLTFQKRFCQGNQFTNSPFQVSPQIFYHHKNQTNNNNSNKKSKHYHHHYHQMLNFSLSSIIEFSTFHSKFELIFTLSLLIRFKMRTKIPHAKTKKINNN